MIVTTNQHRDTAAPKDVQVKVRPRMHVEGQPPGTVMFVTAARAQLLHGMNAVDIVGMPAQGGDQVPTPQEIKADADLKKSSDAPISGPLIDSASCTVNGQGQPLFVLAADLQSANQISSQSETGESLIAVARDV